MQKAKPYCVPKPESDGHIDGQTTERFGVVRRWQLVSEASRDPHVTKADLAVLIAVLDRINSETGTAWPGFSTIAADALIDRSTAVRSISRLVELAYLVRESGDRVKSNIYRMGLGRYAAVPSIGVAVHPGVSAAVHPGVGAAVHPGVGAAVHPGVGAAVHLEPASLNLSNEPGKKEQSSLRSDSSSPAADDPGSDEGDGVLPPADGAKRKAERLAQVTNEAIEAFNAVLGKPNGLLPAVNARVGIEKRRQQVQRCLRVARQICEQEFGAPTVTREFWDAYFAEVDRDPFKSGRQEPGRGHENWKPSFEYLTREAVMISVFDGATSEAA